MTPMPQNPSPRLSYRSSTFNQHFCVEAALDAEPPDGIESMGSPGTTLVSAKVHTGGSSFQVLVTTHQQPLPLRPPEAALLAEAILGATARAERMAADPKVRAAVEAYRAAIPDGPL